MECYKAVWIKKDLNEEERAMEKEIWNEIKEKKRTEIRGGKEEILLEGKRWEDEEVLLVNTLKETANKGKKEKRIVKGDSRNKEIENHDRSEIREKVKTMYTVHPPNPLIRSRIGRMNC